LNLKIVRTRVFLFVEKRDVNHLRPPELTRVHHSPPKLILSSPKLVYCLTIVCPLRLNLRATTAV